MMVGGVLALIFWLTTTIPRPDASFLVIGGILFLLGILLVRTHPSPPPPERPRFRLLKKGRKSREK